MAVLVSCPSCRGTLRVPDDLVGSLVRCPSCKNTFTASDADAEPEPRRPPRPRRETIPRRERTEEEFADEIDRPRSRQRPEKVQAIAIMTLSGGIFAVVFAVFLFIFLGVGTCCGILWPGIYYSLVMGILAIIKGSQLLNAQNREQTSPQGIAIMQIINAATGDFVNCTLGILTLVFLNDPPVRRYFARTRRRRYEED
jgi:predicted Zn finger-like uncharacterized protein